MKNIYVFSLFCFLISSSVRSQVIVLQPDAAIGKDTYVSSKTDTANYGDNAYLLLGGLGPQNDTFNLYIKFDLTSITPGTHADTARIDFYEMGQNGGMQGYNSGVYQVKGAWKEDSLNWNNQPQSDTAKLYTIYGDYFQWNGGPGWRSIYIPDTLVQKWIDNPSSNNGIVIKTLNGFYGHPYICSSDWANAEFHPRMIINSNGSKISGKVTNVNNSNPVAGVILKAYDLHNVLLVTSDTSDASGNYVLNVLYPDSFVVRVNAVTGYLPLRFDSIIVAEGQNKIIDPKLTPNANAIAGVQSGTWTKANSPYIISGDIIVKDSASLTIEPGVVVKYSGPFELAVYGCLKAIGTETDSIICTSYDTLTQNKGRGIRFYEADSSITEYCRIENMRSFDGIWGQLQIDMGGGIYEYASDLTIQHCLIRRNFAQTGGGIMAVSYNGRICNINRNRIENNIAYMDGCSYDGGAGVSIYADPNNTSVYFDDNLILNNNFIDPSCYNHEGGGGLLIVGGYFNILNNTFLYNTAKRGPAIYSTDFNGKIQNNIFWFNHEGYNNEQVALEKSNGPEFEVSYNCFPDSGVIFQYWNTPLADTVPGCCNVFTYPNLADTTVGHYWLNPSSPCIDKGYNKMLRTQFDFFDRCRVFDGDYNGTGIVDMGAYEYNAVSFPYLDIGPDKSVCFDTANILSVHPFYQHYQWSTGDTINNTHVLSSDTFYITVNNTLDCYAFDSIVVTVRPLPVIPSLGNDTSLCYGNTMSLYVPTGYSTYFWNDSIAGDNYFNTNNVSGEYFVYVTDVYQCSNYSDTIHVAVNSLPVVDLGNDTTIVQVYSGHADLDAGAGFVNYAWSTGATTQQITVSALSSSLGVHTVDVTVTDLNGCEGTDEINITVESGAGIDEYNKNDISIYPNPVSDIITITIPEKATIEISNINGELIRTFFCNSKETTIDIGDLPNGVYIIKAKTEKEMLTGKIVKE